MGRTGKNVSSSPPGDPAEVFDSLGDFFARHPVDRLGVATFGPIELEGEERGTLRATPKGGWEGVNVLHSLAESIRRKGVVEARPFLRESATRFMRGFLGGYGVPEPAIEAPVHERPGLEGAFLLGR